MLTMDTVDILLLLVTAVLSTLWWRRLSSSSSATSASGYPLPPGPRGWPIVGNLFQIILQRRPFMYVVRDLRARYGPIFTLRMGQRTLVIVTSAGLIHEALVKKGPVFASRPPDSPIRLIFSVGKCAVNSAEYGPLWRALRRNFVTEIVSPSRVKGFGWIRDWAIADHLTRIQTEFRSTGSVQIMSNCRLTICGILACICFGAKIPEPEVRSIEAVLKDVMLMTAPTLPDFLPPALTPLLFRPRLRAARELRRRQMGLLLPLVRARRAFVGSGGRPDPTCPYEMVSKPGSAYVDSLFGLEPPGRGPLGEAELVTLCSEVMSAGTDTSAATLEWAMLHLVLDPAAQERVRSEVAGAVGPRGRPTESDVEGMEYLTAVVKETLRRHPPSHFVLSHAGTEEAELGGYRIPLGASVEIYTAGVAGDPGEWEDPRRWDPERFTRGGEGWGVDVTGAKGAGAVKMVPFGAGRRVCPAASLGMLHVQLMLAGMVQKFRWVAPEGEAPSEEERFAFTVVMKEPLRAVIEERERG